MGTSTTEGESIPCIDLSREALKVLDGDDYVLKEAEDGLEAGWKLGMSRKIREACESHGCFLLVYDGIPSELRQDMFTAMKILFDLPEKTKQKHVSPKPYRSYLGNCPVVPLSQSFGIDDAPHLPVSQAFTNLMWPQGNPSFCETMNLMSSKMLEVNLMVVKMIMESYGVEKQSEWVAEKMTSYFRLMKYRVASTSSNEHDSSFVTGLLPHTDKNALTILCQNEVQGLQVLSKNGNWIQVMVPNGCFFIIVGDTLKAWSNGRLHVATHRVMMKGEEERYSCGLFTMPKEEVVIEVPFELVDKEHPLLYRPFNYGEYISYYTSTLREDALDIFASVSSNP